MTELKQVTRLMGNIHYSRDRGTDFSARHAKKVPCDLNRHRFPDFTRTLSAWGNFCPRVVRGTFEQRQR